MWPRNQLWILFLIISGCTCKQNSPSAPSEEPVVNLAIWANYLTDDMVALFKERTGIEIRVSNFSSNEELLAKLQSGATGIDVAVPSDYMIKIMKSLDLLTTLDNSALNHAKGVNPKFMGRIDDPDNSVSLPFAWTVTGIGINRAFYPKAVAGWRDVFADPALAGHVSLLDDVREALIAALKVKGHSANTTNPEELNAARDLLKQHKGIVKAFSSEPLDLLQSGDIWVAQIYSSDALQGRRDSGGKIDFIMPEEGSPLAVDCVVIPKGTRHPKNAHQLINFLLDPEINLKFVKNILAGPVVLKTQELLPDDLKLQLGSMIENEQKGRFEILKDLGDATSVWDRAWTEVKASKGS